MKIVVVLLLLVVATYADFEQNVAAGKHEV